MKLRTLIIFVFIFITFRGVSYSEHKEIRLSGFNSVPDLASILCLIQDSRNFIWVGTDRGLYRYDGYSCKNFQHETANTSSLSHNIVVDIIEDKSGNLWIATSGGGINKFNVENEQFVHYKAENTNPNSLSSNRTSCLHEDTNGILWIGTMDGGLNRLDRVQGRFSHYEHDPDDRKTISNNFVTAISEDFYGNLWVGTVSGGLNYYDPNTRTFTCYKPDPDYPGKERFDDAIQNFKDILDLMRIQTDLYNNTINCIFPDQTGALWLGTQGNGLKKFDLHSKTFKHYYIDSTRVNRFTQNDIRSILEDSKGILWIGTDGGGLYWFDRKNEEFSEIKCRLRTEPPLSLKYINSICEDSSGIVWIGIPYGNLIKYDREKECFKNYFEEMNDQESMGVRILCLVEDKQGILWFGSDGGGLSAFNREKRSIKQYLAAPNSPCGLSNNYIKAIYEDPSGKLWLGTFGGGLDIFDPVKEEFTHFFPGLKNSSAIYSDIIQSFCEDHRGILWIGTSDNGLYGYDRETGKVNYYHSDINDPNSLSDNSINFIHEDSLNNLWIGTNNGLNRFNPVENGFFRYMSDSTKDSLDFPKVVRTIYEDSSGRIWIGSWNGLYFFDREIGKFTNYTTADGLPDNIISGILEDDNGMLWISTFNGLSKFSPESSSFRNYSVFDGLPTNRFFSSCVKCKNGEIILGSFCGLCSFFPDKMKKDLSPPNIVITDIRGLSKEQEKFHYISSLDSVSFSYKDSFVISFSSLSFVSPYRNQYSYTMEGLNKEWIDLGNKNEVIFSHLEPGKYTFLVKGSNEENMWSKEGASIEINISPPFWRAVWFQAVLILSVAGLILYFHKTRLKIVKQRMETNVRVDRICDRFDITEREKEIIRYILRGKTNREIEKALYISSSTVKNHIYNIYKKLNVANRHQLMSLFSND
ncbi:MAG: hypothetical protein JXB23_03580 [Candidatus Aminicenantes bacterium]|nr:hypothetical protein [Candidatus Aminicenantes bacterium]